MGGRLFKSWGAVKSAACEELTHSSARSLSWALKFPNTPPCSRQHLICHWCNQPITEIRSASAFRWGEIRKSKGGGDGALCACERRRRKALPALADRLDGWMDGCCRAKPTGGICIRLINFKQRKNRRSTRQSFVLLIDISAVGCSKPTNHPAARPRVKETSKWFRGREI